MKKNRFDIALRGTVNYHLELIVPLKTHAFGMEFLIISDIFFKQSLFVICSGSNSFLIVDTWERFLPKRGGKLYPYCALKSGN